jgi:hypothetical protein
MWAVRDRPRGFAVACPSRVYPASGQWRERLTTLGHVQPFPVHEGASDVSYRYTTESPAQ